MNSTTSTLRVLAGGLVLTLLAACSSGVKLDETPVEDRNATTAGNTVGGSGTGGSSTGGASGTGGQSAVTGVNVGQGTQDRAGANAERVVYFDYDSFVIKPEYQSALDAHARYLKANKNSRVVVEGHTDDRGGREYNLALGQKRSEAVRRALSLLGVAEAQLEAVSFGKEKPAASGGNETAYAKNRRAEITYR
jgi:peptidoglycan-associated lipoprotein